MKATIKTTNMSTGELTEEVIDFKGVNSIQEIEAIIDSFNNENAEGRVDFPEDEEIIKEVVIPEGFAIINKIINMPEDLQNQIKEVMEMGNTKITEDQIEQAINREISEAAKEVEESVNESVKTLKGFGFKIKHLITCSDSEIYAELLKSMLDARSSVAGKVRKADIFIRLSDAEQKMEDKIKKLNKTVTGANITEEGKVSLLAKIKSFIVIAVKKAVALVLGISLFGLDTVAILATMSVRIVYNTGREVVNAGKSIGSAFNKDVVSVFKK